MVKSIYLFIALVIIGLIQSHRTPMWHDEIYTQANLRQYTYGQIIEGRLPEGCNEPLFYIIQKADGDSRLFPIVCMALAISIVFYEILRCCSMRLAVLSVVLFLLPKITWDHFTECRPYSLIVLLTTIQWTIYYPNQRLWIGFVSVLLALTDSITIIPTLIGVSMSYKIDKLKNTWIIIIPTMIILYYIHVSVYGKHICGLPHLSNRYFIYLLPIGIMVFIDWLDK